MRNEKQGVIERLAAEKKEWQNHFIVLKVWAKMHPLQLRETTMDPNTRR